MNYLYIMIFPIIVIAYTKRIRNIKKSLKNRDKDKLKVELLFLSLTIIVTILMIYAIESLRK